MSGTVATTSTCHYCSGNSYPLKGVYIILPLTTQLLWRHGGNRVYAADSSPACIATPCHHSYSIAPKPMQQGKKMLTEKISYFIQFDPPKSTAQQRRHCRNSASFLPAGAARAAATMFAIVEPNKPNKPFCGPLSVSLYWTWQTPKRFNGGTNPSKIAAFPKDTRPDLDNLAKLTLDAMTRAGYWHDDAQIAHLDLKKYYGDMTGLFVSVEKIFQTVEEI